MHAIDQRKADGFSMGINTHKLLNALARCSEETRAKYVDQISPDSPSTKVTLGRREDAELIEKLLEDVSLPVAQRKRLTMLRAEGGDILKQPVHSVRAAYDALVALNKTGEPNLEFKLMERWYPVEFAYDFIKGHSLAGDVLQISCSLDITGITFDIRRYVWHDMFEDERGQQKKWSLSDLLAQLELRFLENDAEEHVARLRTANKIIAGKPRAYDVQGLATIITGDAYHRHSRTIELGNERGGSIVVVDAKTDRDAGRGGIARTVCTLPLVRVFIMSEKQWGIVDVDDLKEHKYDQTALEKVVLEPKIKTVLTKLFKTPVHRFFGDLLDSRHGGMVICAAGPTGTGKTMTAECYAEETGRILYPLELSELGINALNIEANMQKIFNRIVAWDAVLLLDEGDVLMSKRGDDLQKNVIVAIFLRLLDYYRGVLFITSNRPQDFDEAFASRITLTVCYPELNEERREQIWRLMLPAAGMTLSDGDDGYRALAHVKLNGRQIRNIVRIARATEGTTLSSESIIEMSKFTVEGAIAFASRSSDG